MKISEIPFERGTIAYRELKVGELNDGTLISVPIAIINGMEKGLTLLVTSGIHGNIINSIEAVRRISVELNPKKVKGRVALVPVMNKPAFITRTRFNIFENSPGPTNMFHVFPGNPEGKLLERLAYVVSREAILDVDYYIDLCTGALGGCRAPVVVMYPTPTELVEKVSGLARAFGTKFILDYLGVAPSTFKGRPVMVAISNGIPAVLSECGEASRLEKVWVDVFVRGINNVMMYLDMIDGVPEIPSEQVILTKDLRMIRANRGGFLQVKVSLGESVSKGQILAEITDVFYNVVERILSLVDGYVLNIATTATVNSGDQVIEVRIPRRD